MTTSTPAAARSTLRRPMSPSAAGSRSPMRCCAGAVSWASRKRREVKIVRSLVLTLLLLCGATAAEAHPHVWITAVSELLYAPDGTLTGVRHAWTFDEMFVAYALPG